MGDAARRGARRGSRRRDGARRRRTIRRCPRARRRRGRARSGALQGGRCPQADRNRLDRLVLCGVESVWLVHAHPAKHDDPKAALVGLREDDQEITALLIQYASPIAAATLSRMINATANLQAASPAFESARLFRMIGVGVEVLRAFALVLVAAAGLSI